MSLALTFDDGPDPDWTARLLDLLDDVGARATFFPIADRAVAHPDLIRRMLISGHTVGLHCHEHVRHSQRDAAWLVRDTSRAIDLLAEGGVTPRLWRTPWGDTTLGTHRLARELGLEIVGWNVDTHDWRGDAAAQMFTDTRAGLQAGAVILAHDGIGPGARRDGAAQTLGYVAMVAAHAQAAGLELASLTPAPVPA